MKKILEFSNSTLCTECGCHFSYENEDVTEVDERKTGKGHSLFWLVTCPICGRELVVIPEDYVVEAAKRQKEILNM